jgi:predicted DNA-binding transcriptional regulator YafY
MIVGEEGKAVKINNSDNYGLKPVWFQPDSISSLAFGILLLVSYIMG